MTSIVTRKDTHRYWDKLTAIHRLDDAPKPSKSDKVQDSLAQMVINIVRKPHISTKLDNRVQAPSNLPDDLKEFTSMTKYDAVVRLYERKGWELPKVTVKSEKA